MTYTLNEHLKNSSIAEDDIFMVFPIVNNRKNNFQLIGRWFLDNPQTHFKYIQGTLKDKSFKLNLNLLKILYPNVRFITTIDNPWCRLHRIYDNYSATKKEFFSLTNFVKLIPLIPQLSFNILDSYPPDRSIIFLRNEYIASDFSIFSKSLNALSPDPDPVDYRQFFDNESNDIICSIYQKDIEFFYPELLS